MKNKRAILLFALPFLVSPALFSCGSSGQEQSSQSEQKPLEIGDTVKEWKSRKDNDVAPIMLPKTLEGKTDIVDTLGHEDNCSLHFVAPNKEGEGYVGSDCPETPFFLAEDAKNGDVISLYYYIPEDSNLASITLQLYPFMMFNPVAEKEVAIGKENEKQWIRIIASFDSVETLGAIRLAYKVKDPSKSAEFYIDDINITLGEETVKTGYSYDEESLYKTYEGYLKVGTCLNNWTYNNREMRKIVKDNFNSITPENEAKPERILDQEACQALLEEDEAGVAITMKPFEPIYDFCEANHLGVRHHTFVWFDQTPAWFFTRDYTLEGEKASRELMLKRMENFIRITLQGVNKRWPGLVYAIDVANEAVENGSLRTKENNWYATVGEDFVYHAFVYANRYKDPNQKLYYNDFAFDYQPSWCRYALNNVLRQAIDEKLLDGVGLQGHLDSNANMNNIIEDAKMIFQEGLECQITELDITTNGDDENSLLTQKNAYKNLMKKILRNNEDGATNINAVIVWGITDTFSWKRGQYPLLFSSDYAKKPAYYGFLRAIHEY